MSEAHKYGPRWMRSLAFCSAVLAVAGSALLAFWSKSAARTFEYISENVRSPFEWTLVSLFILGLVMMGLLVVYMSWISYSLYRSYRTGCPLPRSLRSHGT